MQGQGDKREVPYNYQAANGSENAGVGSLADRSMSEVNGNQPTGQLKEPNACDATCFFE